MFKVLVEENDTKLNGCDMITVIAPDFFLDQDLVDLFFKVYMQRNSRNGLKVSYMNIYYTACIVPLLRP